MKGKQKFIRFFEDLGVDDVSLVGGKTASLGELYPKKQLSSCEIRISSRDVQS
jgi:pyruvate,water dikinase